MIDTIYADEHFAVLNKPSGISVLADMQGPSYWEQLKEYFSPREIFKVHRLDKGTSGLMLVAFSQEAQAHFLQQFRERSVEKWYIAQCMGIPDPGEGFIDAPISQGRGRKFRVAGPASQKKSYPSRTEYKVLSTDGMRSTLLVKPLTGRTHQIRVHFAHIGHPLVGDTLYGKPWLQKAERLMLHAYRLRCISPTGEVVEFESPVPFLTHDGI